MPDFILAFDQGTTSSRAIVFNHAGSIISTAQKEFTQIFPSPGWVEHNPNEIWATQLGVAAEAVSKAGLSSRDIAAIAITNQRETTVIWDKKTGVPIYNAIVWQDRRTANFCDNLKRQNLEIMIQKKTGLIIDAYFSATKIHWILNNVEGARQKAEAGNLAFGTIDSWLIWNLTQGEIHATDITNASRTMLFNIVTQEWDDELLNLFNIPKSMLPQVKQSSEVVGNTSAGLFSSKIPIAGVAGDQHAALFGQLCLSPGMVKNTYGTGCFMLMNIGDKAIISKNNLVTTIAWKINHQIQYALEGSIFIAGAVVQWLRDGLGIIRTSAEVETLAAKVKDNGGVYFVPAFAGLGAPHWNQHARAMITGITRGTTASHIARAALEAIAYQTMEVLNAMQADAGIQIKELRVDGGATANNFLMQFQADVLQTKVVRPKITETTAAGAAYLAGLAIEFWKDVNEISRHWEMEKSFEPAMADIQIKKCIENWNKAVKATTYHAEI